MAERTLGELADALEREGTSWPIRESAARLRALAGERENCTCIRYARCPVHGDPQSDTSPAIADRPQAEFSPLPPSEASPPDVLDTPQEPEKR